MNSPSAFPLAPLSFLADVRPSGVDKHTHPDEVPVRLCNYTDIYYRERITDDIAFMEASATSAEVERFLLAPGDVLMTKDSETADDIGIPALVTEHLDGVILGYHNTLMRPSARLEPRFLFWFLNSRVAAAYWETKARGVTRVGLRTEDVAALPVPQPPLDTQRRIADMLDEETARIDTLIEKNERVLELLGKRETSLVTAAVTGALEVGQFGNPRPPGRGHRMNRFVSTPLKYIVADRITNGVGLPAEHENPDWPRYIRTTDIAGPRSLRDDIWYSQPPGLLKQAGVEWGDLLLTNAGMTIGKSYLHTSETPAVYAGYLTRVRPDPAKADPRFIAYCCQSQPYWDQINVGATRSTIDNFSSGKYQDLRVPLPPLDTQRRIADKLDAALGKMDLLRSAVDRQKKLLRLRRQALITAAVTGQIEV